MEYSKNPKESVETFVDKFHMRDSELSEETVDYRMALFEEEAQETIGAWKTSNPEELVDGHIDIIVIALGNLAIFGVNFDKAFDQVMTANMAKEIGKRKESDPEEGSIYKPAGWVGPNHSDNHGALDELFPKD